MNASPLNEIDAATEVSHIGSTPGAVREKAEALLEPLYRLVPFQGAVIHLVDPDCHRYAPAVLHGYEELLCRYMASPAITDEIELVGLTRNRAALRGCDLPFPPERIQGWVEYMRPAGFREGVTVGLFANDGRHLGVLALHTDTERHPTAAARDLIGALAPIIANAVDPLRSITWVAEIIGQAYAAIVLTRGGRALPLPGLPGHRLLDAGSDVLAVAAERATASDAYDSFLYPDPADDAPSSHVRVIVLSCPTDALQYLTAVVLLCPPGNLHGLTRRELEILGFLTEGWPNRRIAAALFVTMRTVAAHVEHILAKLGTPTRTLAAVRALRLGLYVPRPPTGTGTCGPAARG